MKDKTRVILEITIEYQDSLTIAKDENPIVTLSL
jgi:hypothetical protein